MSWGRHIIVDLLTGNELDAKPETIEPMREETRLQQRFAAPVAWGSAKKKRAILDDLVRAAELRLHCAHGWLRELEKDRSSVYAPDGGLVAIVHPLRQVARGALRRLGAMTEFGYPPVAIESLPPHAATGPTPVAAFGAERIERGMTMSAVLELARSPERVAPGTWSYDVEGAGPITVDVTWDMTTATVASVEVRPPHWETHWPDQDVLYYCNYVLGLAPD